MKRWLQSYPSLFIAFCFIYTITAYSGLQINAINNFASLIWLPSGIALAFLLIFGWRFWPAILLGAAFAHLLNNAPLLTAIGVGIGYSLEALTAVYLLRRVVKIELSLERVNDVLGLVFFGAIFSTTISALIGTLSLWVSGLIGLNEFGRTFLAWWTGNGISVLIICSLILVWSRRTRFEKNWQYIAELTAYFASLLILTEIVFGNLGAKISGYPLRSYLIFPIFIWSALRFSQRVTITGLTIFSSLAIIQTIRSFGPFNLGIVEDNLLNLQLFIVVLATSAMVLAAAISERKSHERKKDEFISVASHELKTPLTSIKAYTQTLQLIFEKKGDNKASSYMNQVNRQLERLNRLVAKMLDLTRIQEGKIILDKEQFVIGPLLKEIAAEVAETTHHIISVEGHTNTKVTADKDRISRVLTNLLSNAVKYSPKADKIIIKAVKKDSWLTISVKDFGAGVPKSDQKFIFEQFYQSSTAVGKQQKSSLGLGLFISKDIVQRHGGQIWVKSQKSKTRQGSTFYFTLPL